MVVMATTDVVSERILLIGQQLIKL